MGKQTNGYIWVGTYSGLYRYGGIKFEAARIDENIYNVMVLYVDRKGRLWIGTNDTGLLCYDPITEEKTCYTTENGYLEKPINIKVLEETLKNNIPKEIENAFENGDYELYTIMVYALKSSARIIGASRLSEISAKMEEAGKNGDVVGLKPEGYLLKSINREELMADLQKFFAERK